MLEATVVGSEARSALGAIVGVGPAIADELAAAFAAHGTPDASTRLADLVEAAIATRTQGAPA